MDYTNTMNKNLKAAVAAKRKPAEGTAAEERGESKRVEAKEMAAGKGDAMPKRPMPPRSSRRAT